MVVLAGSLLNAGADILTGPVTNPANGHIYYLLAEDSWQNSEAQAVALGGHLATVNDQDEQAWIFTTFNAYGGVNRSLWIGLSDAAQEGDFQWVTGEALDYTHWLPLQPDNSPATDGETYVHMLNVGNIFGNPAGFWNDLASPNTFFHTFDPLCGVVEVAWLILSIQPLGGDKLQLCWNSGTNLSYQVQSRTEFGTNPWSDLGFPVAGSPLQTCVTDQLKPSEAQRYYRVAIIK